MKEGALGAGLDDLAAVGLGKVAGELGDGFTDARADGDGEARLHAHAGFDLTGDLLGGTAARKARWKLAVGFVYGDTLAHDKVVVQDSHNVTRHLTVALHSGTEKDGMRAEAARQRGGHGAMDTVAARRVVGGANDAAPVRVATDDNGLAGQGGIIQLFDGGEEAVEVAMENAAIPVQ